MFRKNAFISQDQKQDILKATDILSLIGEYVQLKASGKNYLGLCPFHKEKTPSFTVSPNYQNYKCYGCGRYGNAISFIMEIENFKFLEALHFLADRTGIQIKGQASRLGRPHIETELGKCLSQSFEFFRSNLLKASPDAQIKKYLKQRLISKVSAENFQLGYIGTGWTKLLEFLKKNGVDIAVQEEAGLVKTNDRGKYYDRLRERLVFPIRDINNRTLGFAGRAIGEGSPKYINPPETELYKKSGVLYGVYEAHKHIRKKRRVIIVEGYLDVIRLHEHSLTETVGACGTALTEKHIQALSRLGVKEALLLFDGDAAGIKAAEKIAGLFLTSDNDIDSKVVILPDGLDPDDYFKKYGSGDFQSLLNKAKYDFEFIINQTKLSGGGKGIKYRQTLIEKILPLIRGVKNAIKKELFLTEAAKSFGVEKQKLQKNLNYSKPFKKRSYHRPESSLSDKISFVDTDSSEIKFLQYLILHPESITSARKYVAPEDLARRDLSDLYARFLQLNDEEFLSLKPRDFPEVFIEYNELLINLLHYSKYRPSNHRPSQEMDDEYKKNEEIFSNFIEKNFFQFIAEIEQNAKTRHTRMLDAQEAGDNQVASQIISKINKIKQKLGAIQSLRNKLTRA